MRALLHVGRHLLVRHVAGVDDIADLAGVAERVPVGLERERIKILVDLDVAIAVAIAVVLGHELVCTISEQAERRGGCCHHYHLLHFLLPFSF